MDMRKRNGTR